jgi:2-polyprenyl-6-methoxyphenol hydroxylase-like FAD-dependent oxidoreductase
VISEEALLERLRAMPHKTAAEAADWTVYAARPLPVSVEQHRFGSRTASLVAVELKDSAASACWIEALEFGWLFLVPVSATSGWLISIGGPHEALLAQSRLIAAQIEISGVAGAAFPAYPGIVDPVCAPGWLACGTAALSFDPLCGDGTGNAVREAILAAAVIRAASAGENVDRLLAHYRARLIAGCARHLELCRGFYLSGNRGPWWEKEIAYLEEGIVWCGQTLGAGNVFRYRLNGLELQAIK